MMLTILLQYKDTQSYSEQHMAVQLTVAGKTNFQDSESIQNMNFQAFCTELSMS